MKCENRFKQLMTLISLNCSQKGVILQNMQLGLCTIGKYLNIQMFLAKLGFQWNQVCSKSQQYES